MRHSLRVPSAVLLATASLALAILGCGPRRSTTDQRNIASSTPATPRQATPSPQPSRAVATPSAQGPSPPDAALPYTVLGRDVYDAPVKTQLVVNLLVPGPLTDPGLRATLQECYRSLCAETGFRYHTHPTHIFIFAYTSRARAQSGEGLWVARLQKLGEEGTPEVEVRQAQIAQQHEAPSVKNGRTEAQRQAIWSEVVAGEDRARDRAAATYPNDPDQQAAYQSELVRENKRAVMQRHGLSDEELGAILQEGLQNDWPFPPARH